MDRKKLYKYAGVVGALFVPAIVLGQLQTFNASDALTSDRLNGMVNAINNASGHGRCRVALQNPCGGAICTATCPSNFVVTGGGCRTAGTGTLKGSTPGFDPASVDLAVNNGFPAPNAFDGDSADPLDTEGARQWDRYICEAAAGTMQSAYALCCPL
jgi:hypothetical protein